MQVMLEENNIIFNEIREVKIMIMVVNLHLSDQWICLMKKNAVVVSIWLVVQKVSRLVSLVKEVQEIQNGNSTLNLSDAIKSMDDTSKDLVNYTAMQWVRNVKPYLKKGEQK